MKSNPVCVLLVHEQPARIEPLYAILEASGMSLTVITTRDEAAMRLRGPEHWDIVVSDLSLSSNVGGVNREGLIVAKTATQSQVPCILFADPSTSYPNLIDDIIRLKFRYSA